MAKIAVEYPDLLGVLSNGFKDAVDAKDPGGALHLKTQNTLSNGEAILKVSKALCDLILTVVTLDGQTWDPYSLHELCPSEDRAWSLAVLEQKPHILDSNIRDGLVE